MRRSFGLDNLKLVDVSEPAPGPGEVLDVEAFSSNHRHLPDALRHMEADAHLRKTVVAISPT